MVRRGLFIIVLLVSAHAYANLAPVVDNITVNPGLRVRPGTEVTITINAHDPDCPDVCVPTPGINTCGLYIRNDTTTWSATGGTFSYIDAGDAASPYVTRATWIAPDTTGAYTIEVYLADSGSWLCGGRQSTTASISISVATGQPP